MDEPNVSATSTREGVADPVAPASDPGAGVDDPLIEVFGLLLEAHARLVSRLDQDLIDGCGMTLQSFEVLIRLARTPGSSLTAGELARAVALSSGGATRLIDRLEEAGLVAREPDDLDRRVVRVGLTSAGGGALVEALPIHLEGLERHLAAPLARNEVTALKKAVRSIRDGFDARVADG